jgi:hypothetical protein
LCFCFVFLRLVAYVAKFFGLFIWDCPFGILWRLLYSVYNLFSSWICMKYLSMTVRQPTISSKFTCDLRKSVKEKDVLFKSMFGTRV